MGYSKEIEELVDFVLQEQKPETPIGHHYIINRKGVLFILTYAERPFFSIIQRVPPFVNLLAMDSIYLEDYQKEIENERKSKEDFDGA